MNTISVTQARPEANVGLFVTFEGIEGVGKSTQLQLLADRLEKWGVPITVTQEPGGTALGNEIRAALLQSRQGSIDHMAELLLLFAARAQHLAQVIFPALRAGGYVLCDRFTDATYAYQGAGRGIDIGIIRQLEQMVQGDFRPDYTIVLDADPQLGLARARARGALDRIEQEKLDFFERVRQSYLSRAQAIPDRYYVIDATQSIEKIHHDIIQKLCPTLASSHPPRLGTPLMGKYMVVGTAAKTQAWVSAWVAKGFCQHRSSSLTTADHAVACGLCPGCRWFREGYHPDYLALSPEGAGARISIDQVRAAIQFLTHSPQQGVCRAVVIEEAHTLTVAAANAFLKTLEEPAAESVLIILATAHPSLLLGTIRSRCFQIRPSIPAAAEAVPQPLVWAEADEQLLGVCHEVFGAPERICKVVESLSKSMDLREVLYSLLKLGYIMAHLSQQAAFVCEGLSPSGQQFLRQIAERLGMNLWVWLDTLYENMQGLQQGISLNAVLLLESLFINGCLLGKQGRQALDGSSIVSYDQR